MIGEFDVMHWPPAHTWFEAVQSVPHVPQLRLSLKRSTQSWPHLMICALPPGGGVEHEELQTPAEQAWPAGQTLPQPPQFIASWLVPMQTPPHSDW
jgi:hypothetical protein